MTATSVANLTSPQRDRGYITPDMFRTHTRAGVPTDNLVPKGTPADQEAALAELIDEAASWVNDHAEQVFYASVDTVSQQVNVDGNGYVTIFPRYRPVIGLVRFGVGVYPNNVQDLDDLSGTGVTDDYFTVPTLSTARLTSSEGPLQFGGAVSSWSDVWVSYDYVHSYPVGLLTAPIEATDTTIAVDETAGIIAGKTWLTLRAGARRWKFLATSVSTADAGGLGSGPGLIGCEAAPWDVPNPSIPVQVDNLPSSLITVNVLVTRALIKQKPSFTPKGGKKGGEAAGDDYAEAWEILSKHLKVAQT